MRKISAIMLSLLLLFVNLPLEGVQVDKRGRRATLWMDYSEMLLFTQAAEEAARKNLSYAQTMDLLAQNAPDVAKAIQKLTKEGYINTGEFVNDSLQKSSLSGRVGTVYERPKSDKKSDAKKAK